MELLLINAYGTRGLKVNRAEHILRLGNGASIEIGQVDSQQAYHRYQGRSFSLIFTDEAGAFSTLRWCEMLRSNLRAPDHIPTRVIWAANPGGPSHVYLHRNFVCKAPPWRPFEHEGTTWASAPSILADNPHLPQRYADDIRAAAKGDSALAKAWIEGHWNIARGAFFGDVIDERVHMLSIEPDDQLIPAHPENIESMKICKAFEVGEPDDFFEANGHRVFRVTCRENNGTYGSHVTDDHNSWGIVVRDHFLHQQDMGVVVMDHFSHR